METNYLISIFFLLLGASVIIRNYDLKTNYNFFWFCDLAPFLFAIGFYIDNAQFLKSIISLGMIGQAISLFSVVPYRIIKWSKNKVAYRKLYILTDILLHLTTFIVLILTFDVAPKIESLKYSLVILIFMFSLTYIFTPKNENVNRIYHLEINRKNNKIRYQLPFHTTLWIFYAFIMVILTYIVQASLYRYL